MLVHCKHRLYGRWEGGIAKGTDGDTDELRHALRLPKHRRSAVGQKWKVTFLPVTELRMKVLGVPSTKVTAARSKKAAMLNKLPVRRWQSRQWHIDTRVGFP